MPDISQLFKPQMTLLENCNNKTFQKLYWSSHYITILILLLQ